MKAKVRQLDISVEDDDPAPLRAASSGESRRRMPLSAPAVEEAPALARRIFKPVWVLPGLAFSGMTFLLLAYLCQSAQIVRSQYRIVAVRGEVRELQAEANDLELSVCELTALERVERIATEHLSMTVPTERRIIEVSWQRALEKGSEVAALR